MPRRQTYKCSDGMCGAGDCRRCHPEGEKEEEEEKEDDRGVTPADALLDIFTAKEAEYEAKADACRLVRDMVTQAVYAGFASGMRFAAEQVRSMSNNVLSVSGERKETDAKH